MFSRGEAVTTEIFQHVAMSNGWAVWEVYVQENENYLEMNKYTTEVWRKDRKSY